MCVIPKQTVCHPKAGVGRQTRLPAVRKGPIMGVEKATDESPLHHRLWYTSPARDWLEGLPIGTGRLAAMILGTHKTERIGLNHEWLWEGRNRERDNETKSHLLQGVRDLLLDGNYADGTRAGNDAFGGAMPKRIDSFQPAGDLYIEFNHGVMSNYRRTLDLHNATVTVEYDADGTRFIREYIAHLTRDLILVRVTADGKPFDCTLWLDRNRDPNCDLAFNTTDTSLVLTGSISDGIDFRVEASAWQKGGTVRVLDGRKITVDQTNEIIVGINIGTSATGTKPEDECAAKKLPGIPDWDDLLDSHMREHARHFGSVHLDLSLDEPNIPTDERMRLVREGEEDPGLMLLYFNLGRYLLCGSSANGALPANLQGKWNEDLHPPWDSDYHHDINLQMNYWIAEPTGMQAYTEALLQHLERFVSHGRKAAMDLYGCHGIWLPIQTDPWGRCTPESWGWAAWIGAAPWLAQHMWWHYEYGQDVDFLRQRAYPFLKDIAAFYEDYLVEDENGQLQIVPSQSPENRFPETAAVGPVSLCVSATMDIQLAWDLLTHTIKASQILDVDPDKRKQWESMLERLPEMQIGSKGQLLEWNQEFEETEPGHRHISHLFGLYPGEQITPDGTPALFAAARKSLELRLAADGGHTGWSRAWTSCCFARLGDGDLSFEHLQHLVVDFATDTLLDLHPPRIFQIEGNLGGAAAVVEMLMQSYHEVIHLLPALPSQWPEGRVSGLRARGGFTVDIDWKDGMLQRAAIVPLKDRRCRVRYQRATVSVTDSAGSQVATEGDGASISFQATAGETYTIT